MKKLWWKLVYPINPALGLSMEERRSVWQRAHSMAKHDPEVKRRNGRIAFIVVTLIILLIYFGLTPAFFIDWIKGWLTQVVGSFFTEPIMLLIYVSPMLFFFLVYRPANNPFVNRALRERGYDICLKCGYWLKELPLKEITHCPECGETRNPMPESSPPDSDPQIKKVRAMKP